MKYLVIFLSTLFLLNLSCVSVPKQYSILSPGIWRATLILKDTRPIIVTRNINKVVTRDVNPESTKSIIPFNFEVVYNSDSSFYIVVTNGVEKIKFDSIVRGHDFKTGNDTMVIYLNPYATQLKCIYENNKMVGEFIVSDKTNYSIPFQAEYGKSYRFNKLPDSKDVNITGQWQTVFAKDSSDQFDAIGEFKQEGSQVTGTFRTETGDFRFMQGDLDSNILKLSCFDGAHAFLFEAQVSKDELTGMFYSGKHYTTTWVAKKSNSVRLIPAESMTKIIQNIPVNFSFPNSNNKIISLNDPIYKDVPKIIQITGSWCPNCRDESEFLIQFLKDNPNSKTKIIALSFERKIENGFGIERIKSYKNSLQLPYEILLGGKNNRDSISVLFPQLDGIKAFPTMLFLNKDNTIYKVHTGFDGPATSKFIEYQKEFKEILAKLEQQ